MSAFILTVEKKGRIDRASFFSLNFGVLSRNWRALLSIFPFLLSLDMSRNRGRICSLEPVNATSWIGIASILSFKKKKKIASFLLGICPPFKDEVLVAFEFWRVIQLEVLGKEIGFPHCLKLLPSSWRINFF